MPEASLNFDLTDGAVVLRLLCALPFIPHLRFKLFDDPPPALEVFTKAGFKPPLLYMRLAILVESITVVFLVLGIYVQWTALVAAASLVVAAGAICSVNRSMKWMWNLGGMEYPVFWAIACIALSLLHWN